jgi:hypothetical protein
MAMVTLSVAPAAVRLGSSHHLAAFGRKGMAVLAFDQQPVGGHTAAVKLTLKRIAPKGAYAAQPLCVDKHLTVTIVLLIDQMNQFPGRTTIKITDRIDVQITVLPFVLDLKVHAHLVFLRLIS